MTVKGKPNWSLQRLLLAWVLGLVVLGQMASLWWILDQLEVEVEEVLDANLLTQASWVQLWLDNADPQVLMRDGVALPPLPVAAAWPTDIPPIQIQLWQPEQQRWWPATLPQVQIEQPGFSWRYHQGHAWRTYDLLSPSGLRARLWQSLDIRQVVVEEVLEATLIPNLVVLALLLGILTLVIRTSLRPLQRLAEHLAQRRADQLAPLQLPGARAEVAQLNEALNSWLVRLQQTFERERGLASDIAHELRTPLTVMQLQARQLADEQQRLQWQNQLGRMQRVIEQLLNLARVENRIATLSCQRLELLPLLQNLLAQLASLPEGRQHQFSLEGEQPVPLWSEPVLLELLLHNLLHNSLRYSPADSLISLQLLPQPQALQLILRDQGPGIAVDQREQVCQRFNRLDQRQAGTGLGLALVQRIAQVLAIRWQLEDRDDGLPGLQISLWLPLAEA
ncbi:ATP-binding protein [Balneatrix alpica]|uniref:ATP-binding protein n=1 Tax=Balneatrix alpica TaxID=75684 RepID=UPI002738D70D|nr:ATP-binding protein [Balneatrix alpica]